MTKKPGNRAKVRRIERKKQMSPEDTQRLKEALTKMGDSIKEMVEKRKQMDSVTKFSQHVENVAAESYGLTGVLSRPEHQHVRGDRIQWYWPIVDGISVIATYVTKDSPYADEPMESGASRVPHGSRAGHWVVDTVGPSGGALFQLTPETAKTIADEMLSAVGWEFAWRDYFGQYGEFEEKATAAETTAEGSLNAEVIPIYNTKDLTKDVE